MQLTCDDVLPLASEFSQQFEVLIANTDELKNQVFHLRERVFCKKLGFSMTSVNGCEIDAFDQDSIHVLLRHKLSRQPIGCFRIVMPQRSGHIWLPFDVYGVPHIDAKLFNWNRVNLTRSAEVSRLALDAEIIRGEDLKRNKICRHLSTALFYAVTAMIVRLNVENVFMVIEPSLGRLISRNGIRLDQISPPFEYYGQRATFTTTGLRMHADSLTLTAPWRQLYAIIEQQLFSELLAKEVA